MMMQPQWPGLGPSYELSSLDGADGAYGENALYLGGGAPPAQQPDGIDRPWWTCGTPAYGASGAGGTSFGNLLGTSNTTTGAGMFGMFAGLLGTLQQLVSALLGQVQNSGQPQNQSPLPTGPQQRFENLDVSSTGDPHLAETGTTAGRNGGQAIDERWDSMTSHDDLVHSNQIEGGYRVSTAVTAPDANGVTSNKSATVHANWDQDAITMNRDGSYAIFDGGRQLQLGKGESATLSGGEQVTVNQDGSLNVNAADGRGGTIATTLRGTGGGVDVTTHGHEIALGGDAIAHGMHGQHGHTPRQPLHRPAPQPPQVQP
ncbi:MAG: hypothetical protein JO036_01790 [Candidatus Eremiobacteraeota bacterium]|nr:hypothetical protein [Candidatus Eremiobacteraeota bacterium]